VTGRARCGACGAIPRMGNGSASIYMASPTSCTAAAVRGAIADPRESLP